MVIDELCKLEKAHGIIETSVSGEIEFSGTEGNDGSVRASSSVFRRKANRVVKTQTQGSVGLAD